MRLRKAIFRESLNLLVNLAGKGVGVAVAAQTVPQPLLQRRERGAAPLGPHCSAQLVRFAGAEAGRLDRQRHDPLLEHGDVERAPRHFFDCGAGIVDRLGAGAAGELRMHHAALGRLRSDQRDPDDEVAKSLRLEARQHRH